MKNMQFISCLYKKEFLRFKFLYRSINMRGNNDWLTVWFHTFAWFSEAKKKI